MPAKPKRLIIDTNLWISFLITKDLTRLDRLISTKKIILLFSDASLAEFLEVVSHPKFKRYFSPADIDDLLDLLDDHAEFVTVTSNVEVSRDPKDNFLLSLALDGKADILLTDDQDLLVLGRYGDTVITTIADLLDKL